MRPKPCAEVELAHLAASRGPHQRRGPLTAPAARASAILPGRTDAGCAGCTSAVQRLVLLCRPCRTSVGSSDTSVHSAELVRAPPSCAEVRSGRAHGRSRSRGGCRSRGQQAAPHVGLRNCGPSGDGAARGAAARGILGLVRRGSPHAAALGDDSEVAAGCCAAASGRVAGRSPCACGGAQVRPPRRSQGRVAAPRQPVQPVQGRVGDAPDTWVPAKGATREHHVSLNRRRVDASIACPRRSLQAPPPPTLYGPAEPLGAVWIRCESMRWALPVALAGCRSPERPWSAVFPVACSAGCCRACSAGARLGRPRCARDRVTFT